MKCRAAALLMLVLHLTGCYSWQPVTISPRRFIEEEQPDRLRILQVGGTQLDVRDPRVTADSVEAKPRNFFASVPTRIALADITAVRRRQLDGGNTVAAVLGVGGTLFFGLYLLIQSGFEGS